MSGVTRPPTDAEPLLRERDQQACAQRKPVIDFASARGFAWGFVSQGFSSATNFVLTLLAARALGASGLGVVAVAFSSYLVALGFQRAFITDPLIANATTLGGKHRASATRNALTLSMAAGGSSALLVALAGVALSGPIGHGLLIVAVWIPVLVVQDFWRVVLFRDGRGRAAAFNDFVWLGAMVAAIPVAWSFRDEWAIIAAWGFGALVAASVGWVQCGTRPGRVRLAVHWWRAAAWRLARWLGATTVAHAVTTYATVFALAALLGSAGYGGLRAVITVFAPLTLVGAAIALPGLPALSRALASSEREALRLAATLGVAAIVLTAGYVLSMYLTDGRIVPAIFGSSFGEFSDLVLPIGIGQIAAAGAVGFILLLTAQQRGSAVFVSTTVGTTASLVLASALASSQGEVGAAWGLSLGSVIGLMVTAALAGGVATARPARHSRRASQL